MCLESGAFLRAAASGAGHTPCQSPLNNCAVCVRVWHMHIHAYMPAECVTMVRRQREGESRMFHIELQEKGLNIADVN